MKALLLTLLFAPLFVFAQDAAPPVVADPNGEFIKLLLESMGGLKGASTLAIVGIVVQLLIKALNLPIVGKLFSESSGKVKLVIVSGLTLIGGVVGLMTVEGLTVGAALIHSTTLAAFMVFANQIYQHFAPEKKP